MYAVKSYHNFGEVVPADILYTVKNIHTGALKKELAERTAYTVTQHQQKSVAEKLMVQQLELISRISALIETMDKVSLKYHSKPGASTFISEGETAIESVKSIDKPKFNYIQTDTSTVVEVVNGEGNYLPLIMSFKCGRCPENICVNAEDIDLQFFKYGAKVGIKRAVKFVGMSEHVESPRCVVQVICGGSATIEADINDRKLTGRMAVWKLFGSLLGIYPPSREFPNICTHIDRWLLIADNLLAGQCCEDNVCRQISTTLSCQDYLVPDCAATLADVVMLSVVSLNNYHANNVELWIKRMNRLLL